ncbi:uncharacterized protein LOC132891834 isoform X2 [Neoarius graeffei]|uniref:uncharacterized protein LOC132891834 isoform X2 n=1 Tax=Neoarius graeffei TaxID=443677 RepID=UPI00298BDFDB|nr:uncharacterized protein LOC132891834 isoform X2 [Neoarius graeffei]
MAKDGPLYFLLICSVGCVTVNVKTGEHYTFKAQQEGPFETVDWKYNGSLVVDWVVPNEPEWFRYEDRASLNKMTGDLSLTLKKTDSGVYKGQFQVAGFLKYFEQTIRVIDPLSKVEVTCEANGTGITFAASVVPQVPANITWTTPNGEITGERIHIEIEKIPEKGFVYCTAKNEVDIKTEELNLENCTKGPEPGSNIGTILGSIIAVVVVLGIVAGVVIWIYKKNKQTYTIGHLNKTVSSHELQSTPGEANGLKGASAELQPCMGSDAASKNQTAEADISS